MGFAVESNHPTPATQDHLGERSIHDMTSDQMIKTEVGVLGEAQIETPNDAVGTSDVELEARLKRLEQLRSQYGVSSPHKPLASADSPDLQSAVM